MGPGWRRRFSGWGGRGERPVLGRVHCGAGVGAGGRRGTRGVRGWAGGSSVGRGWGVCRDSTARGGGGGRAARSTTSSTSRRWPSTSLRSGRGRRSCRCRRSTRSRRCRVRGGRRGASRGRGRRRSGRRWRRSRSTLGAAGGAGSTEAHGGGTQNIFLSKSLQRRRQTDPLARGDPRRGALCARSDPRSPPPGKGPRRGGRGPRAQV